MWFKKNYRISKATRTIIIFDNHSNLPMKTGLLVDREYLHEFNYDDFRLVKEERNTFLVLFSWFVLVKFLNLLLFERRKMAYFKQILQKKPYTCCRNFINLSYKTETYFLYIIYILFLPVCLICKFYTLPKFLLVTVYLLYYKGLFIWEKLSR